MDTLVPYGGFGLMVLAIGDSSFLSLPEVNDVLLMTFSLNQPSAMLKFAAMTTLGSLIGCMLLYSIGRKGGEAFLQKRFSGERVSKVRNWYNRFGVLAIIVPSLLPPPTPFKIFVLSAGAFGISWPKFIISILIGRGIRYFSEGILAVIYGAAAIGIVKENMGRAGLVLALLIVGVAAGVILARRLRGAEA